MNLDEIPRRAVRKVRMDGFGSLARSGHDLVINDLFLYRTVFRRFLKDRITILSRKETYDRRGCFVFDEFSDDIRIKGEAGFRDLPNPEKYQPGNRFVCEFDEAIILGTSGPALTSDGEVIADSVTPPQFPSRRIGIGISNSISENGVFKTLKSLNGEFHPRTQKQNVSFLGLPWTNYYHWTVECLMRIRLLEKYGERVGKTPTLLIPQDPPSWVYESLDLIGYKGEIQEYPGGIVRINRLAIPTFPDPIPAEVEWLKKRMQSGRDNNQSNNRIYIDRSDATVRRVSNQQSVEDVLKQHNFESYQLSKLNVKDQIEIFSKAEIIVSPHGAGLANIVYSEDAKVLELFGEKKPATFDRIADMVGLDYNYLECRQQGVDIQVDTDKLDTALQELLTN